MDRTERLRELFDRYVRRDLSPAEVGELISLLERADAEDILSEPMRRVWEEVKNRQIDHQVDWERMYREVSRMDLVDLSKMKAGGGRKGMDRSRQGQRSHQQVGKDGGRPERRREVWAWRAMAAVFLGLAGLAAYWSVMYRGPVAGPGTAGKGGQAAVAAKGSGEAPDSAITWSTVDNKKVIHLPDGSMVILNRHSRLDYRDREVTLNGEAYFDIVHRPAHPFLVHTGKIVTRVLGTAFDIRAYAADRSIEVTVDHGKVQVLRAGANLGLLSDKEQMRFDRSTDNFHSLRVSLRPVMAWKPEEISFDDITMAEAARRLSKQFKVAFDFRNPALRACRITATFYMEDDLDQIMTVICGVNQSTYEIKGDHVTIDGKGCN